MSASTPKDDARLPDTIDDYRQALLEDPFYRSRYDLDDGHFAVLGKGALGVVVSAFSRELDQPVALKLLWQPLDETRARLRLEHRNTRRALGDSFHSPLLVRIETTFTFQPALAVIEMELVQGVDLDQDRRRRARDNRPYTLDEAFAYGACIGRAVQVVHRAGVIHRDVKPANILLPDSRNPLAKLTDFGISKVAEQAHLTQTGLVAGTPLYAAPEQWKFEPVTRTTDVYSLGLVLFELFANDTAYEGAREAPPERLRQFHLSHTPRVARQLNPDIPETVNSLLTRTLDKKSGRRPDIEEVLAVLDAPRQPLTVQSRPRPSPRQLAAGVAAAALLALAAAALRSTPQPPSAAELSATGAPAADSELPPPDVTSTSDADPAAPTPTTLLAAAPPSPQPTTPTATQPPAPFVALGTAEGAVRLTNTSAQPLTNVELDLFDDNGATYHARVPGALAPGHLRIVPLHVFLPEPPDGFRPRGARVRAETPAGSRETNLEFHSPDPPTPTGGP